MNADAPLFSVTGMKKAQHARSMPGLVAKLK
jgi:hypothetical protein